jgi:membrane-associated phospholipid phosphatase
MARGARIHTVRHMPVLAPAAVLPRARRSLLRHRAGLRQLGYFVAAYLTYFGVRALTEGSTQEAVRNALSVVRLERRLGLAWEGAIQEAVVAHRALVSVANGVYMYGHWPVIVVAGILLFRYRRGHYLRLRDACLLSGLVGLVVFSLFPVAPPRLTDLPVIDTVTRDDAGYRQLVPPSLVNQYAAMPSFHAGWNLLLGIVVFGATRNPLLRALSVLGPSAMIIAVVATANHFVVDVIAGVAIVLACLFTTDRLHRRRAQRPSMEGGEPPRADRIRASRGGDIRHRPSRRQRPPAVAAGGGARRSPHRG